MARKKHPRQPLPPRGGLSASRIRHPGPDPTTAFEFVVRVIAEQRHRHPEDTEEAVMERFAQGQVVLIDASPVNPDDLIQPGTDVFFYRRPAPETPVPYEIQTVYEDDDLLVVDKPPFLATMPRAAHITETATVRLRRATGNEELTPAHRLDRMTSGLLLLTKRRDIRGAYQELFAARQVFKRYTAIAPELDLAVPTVWRSHIEKRHGEVASNNVKGAQPNAETIVRSVERLQPAQEDALHRVHETEGPLARYLLEPVTGRTHQLRVHMCAAGAPILGDPVYPVVKAFGDEDYSVPMRLKSIEIAFEDPLSGQARHFAAQSDVV
ncbi:Ribosomal large subunit pseudouridine synthase A [Corynebacterium glaucum]|uniref:RNA pseudouridylate synthase n=1 Tax=Corynebacterium glaucum TaxID=187491 RepID=A0A1Q2HZN7_9CORY|nr:pseudouridine synthase [Corynebacterium glaucum]AQQ16293.1 Ribosomal large subunit pseudouridine synthase A [Corynebacterium glaucum]WJZ08795.1 Ribosomal large subunit pseudouridine synthase A [Corynebacterium glaucum]